MLAAPDAIILAGGAGLRLKSVTGETPKPMARIGTRPFLELLLLQLKRQGFLRVILSVGQRQEMIRMHFGDAAFGLHLTYALERSPLGTGGGLRQAITDVATDTFLAINGDSYTNVSLDRLVLAHHTNKADATMTIVSDTRTDAGSVLIDEDGRVTDFGEKRFVQGSSYRSAGIYLLNKVLIEEISPGVNISLEEQLFPEWLASGKQIRALVSPAPCIDIGTPERYQQAQDLLADVE